MLRKVVSIVILVLALGIVPLVSAQESATASAEYVDYLSDNYGITLADEVAQDAFTAALGELIGSVEVPAELDLEGFSALEAVLTTVYYANFDEVAFVLTDEQVAAALTDVTGIDSLDATSRHALAIAYISGLIDAAAPAADLNAPVSADFGAYLLGRALDVTGRYKNFTGYVSDADIYTQLVAAWYAFDQVFSPELQAAAVPLIREGVITGYNLKRVSTDSNFDAARTLIYGHANIQHARQLISLLRALGIDAKVKLEPKTSAYLSLAEWGGQPGSTPEDQADLLDDGNWITYAKEYDLAFEFFSTEDRDRFDGIIKAYAQRTDTGEPRITGAWWVPLYSSRVELDENYTQVYNHVVYQDQFYLQSFSLIDNVEAVEARFAETFPDGEHEVWEDIWVNVSFYNYLLELTGADAE